MKYALSLLLVTACAEKIGPPPNDNPVDGSMVVADAGPDAPDGAKRELVDATSMSAWTHVDIATGWNVVDDTGPWDLRFQRFHISVDNGAEVALVAEDYLAVTAAPASGFFKDADEDGDGVIDYALDQGDGWYDYNADTHVLTPKPITYVIRSAEATVKLRLEKYYDGAGTAGWFTLIWSPL